MEALRSIRPKATSEIVGNRLAIKRLIDHLRAGTEPRLLALVGPTGCGKTLVCSLVLEELGKRVHRVASKEALAGCADTLSCARGPLVVLVEDVDVMINADKGALTAAKGLVPLLRRTGSYVLFTSRPSEQRSLSTRFKENIEVFSIGYPPVRDAFVYLSSKLCYDDDEKLLSIVKAYRGNIRECVMNIEQASHETSLVVKDRGFKEQNVFDIASAFLSKPSWGLVEQVMNADPETVSSLVYENMLDKATIGTYRYVNRNMVEGSKLEKQVYRSLDWSIYNVAQAIKLGGMCVALGPSGPWTRLRFPRPAPRKHAVPAEVPLVDIVDLIDSGKMDDCFA